VFCPNCGEKVEESGNAFCPFCGTKFEAEDVKSGNESVSVTPAQPAASYVTAPAQSTAPKGDSKFSKIFVDPDEICLECVGEKNRVIDLFLSGHSSKGWAAILSDKRLYLRGNVMELAFGKLSNFNVQKTIDLEDVTGTGFAFTNRNLFALIMAILNFAVSLKFLPSFYYAIAEFDDISIAPVQSFIFPLIFILLIIFGIAWLISYIKGRHTLFFIEYAGGNIRFDASAIGLQESRSFEKNIRIAKNRLKKTMAKQ